MVDGKPYDKKGIIRLFQASKKNPWDRAKRFPFALKYIEDYVKKGMILDVGCYGGYFSAMIHERFPRLDFIGVDSSTENIRIAHTLYPQWEKHFKSATIYDLPFPDNSFDCITCLEVIEHLDRPIDAVREMNRVLKKNRYLICSTPNAASTNHIWESIKLGYKNNLRALRNKDSIIGANIYYDNVNWNRHIIEFLAVSLSTIFQLNGYELIQHRFIPYNFLERLIPGIAREQIMLLQKKREAQKEVI